VKPVHGDKHRVISGTWNCNAVKTRLFDDKIRGQSRVEITSPRSYRGLRPDRRTTFDARFWLAAAARFDTIWGLWREAFFEARAALGAFRRRTTALAAGAFCTSANVAGASFALTSIATVSGLDGV
jgi:hypothetical protein